jgi:hypothetical protein
VKEGTADMADKKDPREQALADARKQADADTQAHYDRVGASQPTPTQEENDRAKLGFDSLADLDDKEADGSPEEKAPAAYETRSTAAKK